MEFRRHGLAVRASAWLFAGITSMLALTASAQDEQYYISNNGKAVTVSEPFNASAQLRLGTHVAAGNGRVLSVGGNSVYVFGQNTAGEWTQTAKLSAYDSGVLTGPIAFDGTYALVRGYTPARAAVVYSYIHEAGRWRALGVLKGTKGFGRAIGLDGCTAMISSNTEDGAAELPTGERGYVHYFDRCRTGTWTWINSIPAPVDNTARFGASLALSGADLLIGAPYETGVGRVYYYTRSGDTWQLKQTIVPNVVSDNTYNAPHTQSAFGSTIAINNGLALIRMAKEYANWQQSLAREGVVLEFTLTNGLWTQVGQLEPAENVESMNGRDLFGARIAMTPTWVFIAAPGDFGLRYVSYNERLTGSVYAYRRNGNQLQLVEKMTGGTFVRPDPPFDDTIQLVGGQMGSHFGQSVAVLGNQLVVGWPLKSPADAPPLETGGTTVFQLPSP